MNNREPKSKLVHQANQNLIICFPVCQLAVTLRSNWERGPNTDLRKQPFWIPTYTSLLFFRVAGSRLICWSDESAASRQGVERPVKNSTSGVISNTLAERDKGEITATTEHVHEKLIKLRKNNFDS